jgi:two-component system NarL family response regulator
MRTIFGPRVTKRELEILDLIAKGMSNREIANQLFVGENAITPEKHFEPTV